MGMSIGELFISLGFDVDDAKLKSFNENIKESTDWMEKQAIAATGAVTAMTLFVEKQAMAAVHLQNMNTLYGANIQKAQEWALVTNQLNPAISVAQAEDVFVALQNKIAAIGQGKAGGGVLSRLIGDQNFSYVNASAGDVLEAIAKNKEKFLNDSANGSTRDRRLGTYASLLNEAGGLAPFMQAFDLSAEERKQRAAPFMQPESNIKDLNEFAGAMSTLDQAWVKLEQTLAGETGKNMIGAINRITKALEQFDQFATKHPDAGTAVTAGAFSIGAIGALKMAGRFLGFGGGAAATTSAAASGVGAGTLAILAAVGTLSYQVEQAIEDAENPSQPRQSRLGKLIQSWTQGANIRNMLDLKNKINLAKGIRHNNPGNLMPNGVDATYSTPEEGIAAMVHNLHVYAKKHGWDTIDSIAGHWAPANGAGNSPASLESYKRTLESIVGARRDQHLNMSDPTVIERLVRGIIKQENGGNPYSDQQIKQGLSLHVTQHIHSTASANDVAAQSNRLLQNEWNTAYNYRELGPVA